MRSACFFVAALTIAPSIALAQSEGDFQVCAAAFEDAQRLQKKGQLLAASDKATACAAVSCPIEIVAQCTKLRESIDEATPTIVVAAEHDGRDLAAAKLFIDGNEVSARLDGLPRRLDPGSHVIRVVPEEGALEPRESSITLRSGERNRRVELRWQEMASAGSTSIGFIPAAIAFALGGAGIFVGATTGILALRQDADLADRCGTVTTCPPEAQPDIDSIDNLAIASTTGFIVGGVGLGTGIILAAIAASQTDDEKPSAVKATANGFSVAF